MPEYSTSVFVFDLDDTLYKEADYRISGLREVVKFVQRTTGSNVDKDFSSSLEQKSRDPLGEIIEQSGLPETAKESLLWVYRLHTPSIKLKKSVKQVLGNLESVSRVLILTDGRSVTQRLKLKALGLDHLPVYISDDYDSEKPSPLRFKEIMNDYSATNYVYVADNPAKDFIAANDLGWLTIGLHGDTQNIHSQELEGVPEDHHPKHWINDLSELMD